MKSKEKLSFLLRDAEKMQQAVNEAVCSFRHLEYLGAGSSRQTYGDEKFVYKIPLTKNGLSFNAHCTAANLIEGYSQELGIEGSLAKAEIAWHESGIPVVKMERIIPLDPKQIKNNHKAFELSRLWFTDKQVGITKKGVLVAYDYALWRPTRQHVGSFVFKVVGVDYNPEGIEYRVVKRKAVS